jgi:hypothetical protein
MHRKCNSMKTKAENDKLETKQYPAIQKKPNQEYNRFWNAK